MRLGDLKKKKKDFKDLAGVDDARARGAGQCKETT
jgi:hypothetical protein